MNVAKRLHWRTLMHECRVNVSVACLAVAKSLFGRAYPLCFSIEIMIDTMDIANVCI